MSKTFRKTNRPPPSWLPKVEDLRVIDGRLFEFCTWNSRWHPLWRKSYQVLSPQQYVVLSRNRYYSDRDGGYNAPARYRRSLNRYYRRKLSVSLKYSLALDLGESFLNQRPKKNANYLWF